MADERSPVTAPMWMEARCDGLLSLPARYGREKCHETGPGGFYRANYRAVRDTKRAGWKLIAGEWFCPACARARDA